MDRRDFLQAATLAAATGGTVLAADAPLPAQAQAVAVAAASPGEPQMRRFEEQRWVLDNIIHSVGLDWDQPRTIYWNAPIGFDGAADFAGIRQRVQKYA